MAIQLWCADTVAVLLDAQALLLQTWIITRVKTDTCSALHRAIKLQSQSSGHARPQGSLQRWRPLDSRCPAPAWAVCWCCNPPAAAAEAFHSEQNGARSGNAAAAVLSVASVAASQPGADRAPSAGGNQRHQLPAAVAGHHRCRCRCSRRPSPPPRFGFGHPRMTPLPLRLCLPAAGARGAGAHRARVCHRFGGAGGGAGEAALDDL